MSESTAEPGAKRPVPSSDDPAATDPASVVEHEPIGPPPPLPLPRAALRVCSDADGRAWRVFERDAPATMPCDPPVRCLYFDSDVAVRRVCDYPSHWATLSDEELLRVSWRR